MHSSHPSPCILNLESSCSHFPCSGSEDEEQIIALQGAGRVSELLCMLGSLVVTMIGGGIMFEADEVGPKAVFGQVLASAISWPLLYLISSLLEDRPKLHEGEAHVCKVLGQLWKTMSDLRTTNRPVLQVRRAKRAVRRTKRVVRRRKRAAVRRRKASCTGSNRKPLAKCLLCFQLKLAAP